MMSYLRNTWYVAGFPEEATRAPLSRTFLDEEVVIYRTLAGEAVALGDRCPHRFASLSKGSLAGDAIQCPYHALRFGSDGRCVHQPSGQAPPRARVHAYPLAERHGVLWIWMGDPERADASLIPDFSYVDRPGHTHFTAQIAARGDYQLVVDNLLDLTHVDFLHPMLAQPGSCEVDSAVSQEGDTVFVDTVIEDAQVRPLVAMLRPDIGKRGRSVQRQRWDAPGLLELKIGYMSGDDIIEFFGGHFLTPETTSTTHYFLRVGQNFGVGQPDLVEQIKAGVMHVFASEDVPMIEQQQAFLKDRDLMDLRPLVLKADAGAVWARRILARRIREEALGAVAPAA